MGNCFSSRKPAPDISNQDVSRSRLDTMGGEGLLANVAALSETSELSFLMVPRVNNRLQRANQAFSTARNAGPLSWQAKLAWTLRNGGYWSTLLLYAYSPTLYTVWYILDEGGEDSELWQLILASLAGVVAGAAYSVLATRSLNEVIAEFKEGRVCSADLKAALAWLVSSMAAITGSYLTYVASSDLLNLDPIPSVILAGGVHGITTLVCRWSLRLFLRDVFSSGRLDRWRSRSADGFFLSSRPRVELSRWLSQRGMGLSTMQLPDFRGTVVTMDKLLGALESPVAPPELSLAHKYALRLAISLGWMVGGVATAFTYPIAKEAIYDIADFFGSDNPQVVEAVATAFAVCAYACWGSLAAKWTAVTFERITNMFAGLCSRNRQTAGDTYSKRNMALFASAFVLAGLSLISRLEIIDQFTDPSLLIQFLIVCNLFGPVNAYLWTAFDFLKEMAQGWEDEVKQEFYQLFHELLTEVAGMSDEEIQEMWEHILSSEKQNSAASQTPNPVTHTINDMGADWGRSSSSSLFCATAGSGAPVVTSAEAAGVDESRSAMDMP